MRTCLLPIIVLFSWLAAPVVADEPKGRPGAENVDRAAVRALIKEGNALHDRGSFDDAIKKYREALSIAPDDGEAMYEIAYTLVSKKDLKAAAEMAQAASRSPNPPRMLPVLVANIYDDLGESDRAIGTYRSAIAVDPRFFLLYFNLGVAYGRSQRLSDERVCLENSVALAPLHPGSHFELGRVYAKQGYRTPAVMALTRALALEPSSERAKQFLSSLDDIFAAGLKTDSKGNSTITVDPSVPKDEGDFSGLEILIPMITLSEKRIPEAGGKIEEPAQAHRLITLLKSVGELGRKTLGKGFAAEFYGPFYENLVKAEAVDGFVALALAGVETPEVSSWRLQNEAKAKRAAVVVTRYRWESPERPPLPPEPSAGATPTRPN